MLWLRRVSGQTDAPGWAKNNGDGDLQICRSHLGHAGMLATGEMENSGRAPRTGLGKPFHLAWGAGEWETQVL